MDENYEVLNTGKCYKRVTRGGGGGEVSPSHFSKFGKKYPNFGKKCPDCGHLWVKFLI